MGRGAPLFGLVVLVGCGAGAVQVSSDEGVGAAPHPRARRSADTTTVSRPRATSGRPFAASPITDVGNELTDLALSAIRGEDVAPPSVPTSGPLAGRARIAWRTDARPESLEILGVAFEVTLVMKRGEPDPDADGPARFGAIRCTLALSRGGLRVVGLRPRALSPSYRAGSLPLALRPMEEVARELLAAIRARDIQAYQLTAADRALLDNDTVWSQMVEDRVPPGRVEVLARMLASLPEEPIAYVLDDVAVLARDPDANLFSLAFDFDREASGSFAIETDPLLEVRQLWPLTESSAP